MRPLPACRQATRAGALGAAVLATNAAAHPAPPHSLPAPYTLSAPVWHPCDPNCGRNSKHYHPGAAMQASPATCCVVCQGPARVYCKNDEAFLCAPCDASLHAPANPLAARHARVRVCELCTRKASTVYCKNDRAFLCADCDVSIHAHNPLAARHEMIPAMDAAYELVRRAAGPQPPPLQPPARTLSHTHAARSAGSCCGRGAGGVGRCRRARDARDARQRGRASRRGAAQQPGRRQGHARQVRVWQGL